MTRFAAATKVAVEASQAEVARLLKKHGAITVATMQTETGAAIAFQIGIHRVRFELSVPTFVQIYDKACTEAPRGWIGGGTEWRKKWCQDQIEQIERQRWRALLLVTKAKLELVADGASTIEREFMADLLLPNGQRVEEWLVPQLEKPSKKMPPLLTGMG